MTGALPGAAQAAAAQAAAADAQAARQTLDLLVGAELERAVPARVQALAMRLAERGGQGVAAVLFYGSALRDDTLDGVLDFYVLTDRAADWPGARLATLAGRLLPPNVGYLDAGVTAVNGAAGLEGTGLRAKYAVMTLAQFARGMQPARIDTTLWARFSQPCICVHARSAEDTAAVRSAVVDAVVTAARWAATLGPAHGDAADFWRALYQHTYRAELRVERSSRGVDLVERDLARYGRLLPLAWRAAGLLEAQPLLGLEGDTVEASGTAKMSPRLSAAERRTWRRRWQLRERMGRPLNVARLMKAALTFDNAIDYVAWKVERHSGVRIEPTAFQRRHPLLAAPALYWRLRSRKVLR